MEKLVEEMRKILSDNLLRDELIDFVTWLSDTDIFSKLSTEYTRNLYRKLRKKINLIGIPTFFSLLTKLGQKANLANLN